MESSFQKFSVLSYVKEILADNKHLKQLPSLRKSQFSNRICNCFSLAKMAFDKAVFIMYYLGGGGGGEDFWKDRKFCPGKERDTEILSDYYTVEDIQF